MRKQNTGREKEVIARSTAADASDEAISGFIEAEKQFHAKNAKLAKKIEIKG